MVLSLKNNELTEMLHESIKKLPTPANISYYWNSGSALGVCLLTQIISGLFLSMHYCPNTDLAFYSIIHINQEVNYGFIMRNIHMNGASLYFMCMFIHIGRGLYYQSFKKAAVWMSGTTILILSMATAFMGYILPWGQMSFWGATVITNLISTIPYLGNTLVMWIWGGFSINNATLNRFYSLHFILPFVIIMMVIIHLFFLHSKKSSNPMGSNSLISMLPFHPYFVIKDSITFILLFIILTILILQYPFLLSDPDNFIAANPMVTPIHIQPEWYFLFAYAILRSIPNKLGGVVALMLSIMILYTLPMNFSMKLSTSKFYPINQILFWTFIMTFIVLTWTGSKPIESPFITISQVNSIIYFLFLTVSIQFMLFWDQIIFFNPKM